MSKREGFDERVLCFVHSVKVGMDFMGSTDSLGFFFFLCLG